MAVTGLCMLAQRLTMVMLFQLLRVVWTTIQYIYWQLNGTARLIRDAEDPQNFERCAQVLQIRLRYRFGGLKILTLKDFICTHVEFVSPQYIIDNDHISLMSVNEQSAIFCQPKRKGMMLWRSEFASFIIDAQAEYADRLIVLPLTTFHRMSEMIGDPRCQLIFIMHTGRCGSTLLTQMFETTGNCVTRCEPNSPNVVAARYRKYGDTPEVRQLARDVIRWECRPYERTWSPLAYVLKISPFSNAAQPLFSELFPGSRCLFIYRDTVKVAQSFYRISHTGPVVCLVNYLGQYSSSLTEGTLRVLGLNGVDYRIRLDNDLTFGVAVAALATSVYLEMRRRQSVNLAALRYEDLVERPLELCRDVLEFCRLPTSLAEAAVVAINVDSQRKSGISKSVVGGFKVPLLTSEMTVSLNDVMTKYGVPPAIGKTCVLDGTLCCQ